MTDQPIQVEVWIYGTQQPDQFYATFHDAAVAAAGACDLNTAWHGDATNVETGEVRSRSDQLAEGFPAMDGETDCINRCGNFVDDDDQGAVDQQMCSFCYADAYRQDQADNTNDERGTK